MKPQFKFNFIQNLATPDPLTDWVNSGSGVTWALGAEPFLHTFLLSGSPSKELTGELSESIAGTFNVSVKFDCVRTGYNQNARLKVRLLDALLVEIGSAELSVGVAGVDKVLNYSIVAASAPVYMSISMRFTFFFPLAYNVDLTIKQVEISSQSANIREPLGWKSAVIKLERDTVFKSLVEFFEIPLGFYGSSLQFLRDLEAIFGIDYKLGIEILIKQDEESEFELMYSGVIDLAPIEESSLGGKWYKAKVGLVREDLWATFMNRKDTPVNVQSEADLYGNTVSVTDSKILDLVSQKIKYLGDYYKNDHLELGEVGVNTLAVIDFDKFTRDDFKKFNLGEGFFSEDLSEYRLIPGILPAPWDGLYTIDLRIELGTLYPNDASPDSLTWYGSYGLFKFYIGVAGSLAAGTAIQIDTVQTTEVGGKLEVATFNGSFRLKKGQQLAIWMLEPNDGFEHTVFGKRLKNWITPDAKVATINNIVLNDVQVIDGYATSHGDTVLVGYQDDPKENGIYICLAGFDWVRHTAANSNAELQDAAMKILNGDTYADTYWVQSVENIDIGTTDIGFELTQYDNTYITDYPGSGIPDTHFSVIADTTFKDSEAAGFLTHDVGSAILDRITEAGKFHSEFLGHTSYTVKVYDSIGDGFRYMLNKGVHLKGYTLVEKQFFMSFMDWYKSMDAILNLSLGYETIDGEAVIAVRKHEEQFDDSSMSVEFLNVSRLLRKYDLSEIYKTVKVGYTTSKSDAVAVNDDPSTATYASRFKRTGQEEQVMCDFIAAPLLIEETRRQAIEKTKEYRFDDNTFITAINPVAVEAGVFKPELTENFSDITGLDNPDYRYNYRLWPVWNFLRHLNIFNGCLQKYSTSVWRFTEGTGNYGVSAVMDPASESLLTGSPVIAQNANIRVDIALERGSYIHSEELYECTVPLSWSQYKTIVANRKLAIGISRDDTDPVPYFIKSLSWNIVEGKASLMVWPKVSQVSSETFVPDSVLMETGDFILQETGDTIKVETAS